MVFSEFETALIETAMERFMAKRRPPAEIRPRLDLSFKIEDQSVSLYEIRPYWRDPAQTIESPVAKATFVQSVKRWRVFWRRADLKWHKYEPCAEVERIDDFLDLVHADEHHCFWG